MWGDRDVLFDADIFMDEPRIEQPAHDEDESAPAEENPNNAENQGAPTEPLSTTTTVSAINQCQTSKAEKLVVYDASFKLQEPNNYEIGGTWSGTKPDLWFFYTTTEVPMKIYLLNLFVCHRRPGTFSIGISSSNDLTCKPKSKENNLQTSKTLKWHTFNSMLGNESYYIKSFCFNGDDLKNLEERSLYIPLKVEIDKNTLNREVAKMIKLNHDFGDLLSKQYDSDFTLESASHKKFSAHKIVLASQSPVLRELIKSSKSDTEIINIPDTGMELLLEFIYTGTIKDIHKKECLKLLEIADRFQLKNLFTLSQYPISEQINVDNAVEVALISEKYKLEQLQATVFEFIKDNQNVLQSEGWNNLSDVNLTKKLFQYLQKNRSASD